MSTDAIRPDAAMPANGQAVGKLSAYEKFSANEAVAIDAQDLSDRYLKSAQQIRMLWLRSKPGETAVALCYGYLACLAQASLFGNSARSMGVHSC